MKTHNNPKTLALRYEKRLHFVVNMLKHMLGFPYPNHCGICLIGYWQRVITLVASSYYRNAYYQQCNAQPCYQYYFEWLFRDIIKEPLFFVYCIFYSWSKIYRFISYVNFFLRDGSLLAQDCRQTTSQVQHTSIFDLTCICAWHICTRITPDFYQCPQENKYDWPLCQINTALFRWHGSHSDYSIRLCASVALRSFLRFANVLQLLRLILLCYTCNNICNG